MYNYINTISLKSFIVILFSLFTLSIAAWIAIDIQKSQLAFEEQHLRNQVATSRGEVQMLSDKLSLLESPASLHTMATSLGMKPNPHMLFLDLKKEKVIGAYNVLDNSISKTPQVKTKDNLDILLHTSQLPVDDTAFLVSRTN